MRAPGALYWLRLAALTAVRSGRVTLVLSVMVAASVAVMVILSALSVGINDAMIHNSVSLYTGHVWGAGIPTSITPPALQSSDIRAVLKRIAFPGFLYGRQGPVSSLLVAVDPAAEQTYTALPAKVVSGRYPQSRAPEVFLGQRMAEILGVGVGDVVDYRPSLAAPGIALVVSGIFRTGFETLDQGMAFCPLGVVEGSASSWDAAIFLKDGVEADKAAAAMNAIHSTPGLFKSWMETMPDLAELVALNYVSMSVVLVLVFGVISLSISCIFVVYILKNIREYAIMVSVGVTHAEITCLVFLQIVLINVFSAIVGQLVGVVASIVAAKYGLDFSALTHYNRYFAISAIVRPRLTSFSLALPFCLASAAGCLASLWPSIIVMKYRPASLLKQL